MKKRSIFFVSIWFNAGLTGYTNGAFAHISCSGIGWFCVDALQLKRKPKT